MSDRIIYDKDGEHFFLGNREVSESEYREYYPKKKRKRNNALHYGVRVPDAMLSESIAVHPDQVREAMADAKKRGVPTEFDDEGRPKFTSRDHQRRYCQAYNFHNNDENWSGKDRLPDRPEPTQEEVLAELESSLSRR